MSSSKIIKQADHDGATVSEFNFQDIGLLGGLVPAVQHVATFVSTAGAVSDIQPTESFVPLTMSQREGRQDVEQEAEEEVDTGPPPIEISEEDLNQKLSDSFDAGVKEGKELTERGLANVFKALRASSESIHNLRDKILRESEDELINLIMLVARKVIIREINLDRTILVGVVHNALASLSGREEITVRINPEDYLLATSGRYELLHKELINDRLLLKPDPSVAAGFCLVDTDMGIIDASLDSQMDHIFQTLLEQRILAVASTTGVAGTVTSQ